MNALLRPVEIGNVRLDNNLVLSPMAGFSDLPFRILARGYGAGLVCTEMVAATSANRGAAKTRRRMETIAGERPVSIQLFGTDADEVAQAAQLAGPMCEILGFNMGCPAFQIKRVGCGAAMLDRPELAEEMVRTVKDAGRRPVLVKIRAGNETRIDVVAFARRLEGAGADGIILHGRTAAQAYGGASDWRLIGEVKRALAVPLIGNGDVVDGKTATRALEETGCDGLALGRATLGNPRIFASIAHYLETGIEPPAPTPEERVADLARYLVLASRAGLDERHMRAQAQKFTRGLPHASDLRRSLGAERSLGGLLRLVQTHVDAMPVGLAAA